MNSLITLATTTAAGTESTSFVVVIVVYALFFGALWLFFFRPNSKKKKKEAEMKKNAQVGDQIITIGGIAGRIIAVREDSDAIVLETGSDRSKIMIKRWAIGSVETVHEEDV